MVFVQRAALGVLVLIAGCGCPAVLITEVRPGADVTLPVNGQTTAQLLQGGCGEMRLVDARFTSSDASVASVDSISGSVIGKRVGDAEIWINTPGQPRTATSFMGRIVVHVR